MIQSSKIYRPVINKNNIIIKQKTKIYLEKRVLGEKKYTTINLL